MEWNVNNVIRCLGINAIDIGDDYIPTRAKRLSRNSLHMGSTVQSRNHNQFKLKRIPSVIIRENPEGYLILSVISQVESKLI